MSPEPGIPLRCHCRKRAVTSLRCSRCSVPICPDCSRSVPVGMVCKTCLYGKQSHLFDYGVKEVLLSSFASLFASTLCAWILGSLHSFGILLAIWGGLLQGGVVSETCLRVSRHKRGAVMESIVATSVICGSIAGWFLTSVSSGMPFLLFFVMPGSYIFLVIATVVGIGRMRSL